MTYLNQLWLRSLTRLQDHSADERGANLVEYSMLVALIALVCVAAVTQFGETPQSIFESAAQGF